MSPFKALASVVLPARVVAGTSRSYNGAVRGIVAFIRTIDKGVIKCSVYCVFWIYSYLFFKPMTCTFRVQIVVEEVAIFSISSIFATSKYVIICSFIVVGADIAGTARNIVFISVNVVIS